MSDKETKQQRRAKYLDATLNHILNLKMAGRNNFLMKDIFTLNRSLALKTIRFYVQNIDTLKDIYGIEDKVAASKIAGLMASAILRFRPLVPIDGKVEWEEIEDNECNEFLAIYHGLNICAAEHPNGIEMMNEFMVSPAFDKWFKQFMYLLLEREYTAESLIVIFETLCVTVFCRELPKMYPLPMEKIS